MINDLDFETYLIISSDKFGIYLYDIKNKNNLYFKEVNYENNFENLNIEALSFFLEDNIFKIEKLAGQFIKNIYLIIENKKILNLNISFKKKNYNKTITYNYLKEILVEAKDLFKENYQDQTILHMLLVKYFVDDKYYSFFFEELQGKDIRLEVKFISIPQNISNILSKVLQKYQIKIVRFLDQNYIENYFEDDLSELSEMIYRIKSGQNQNEVDLVPKNIEKKGFFEKFFQLFS